jgi:hypothetical protein
MSNSEVQSYGFPLWPDKLTGLLNHNIKLNASRLMNDSVAHLSVPHLGVPHLTQEFYNNRHINLL